MEDTMNKIDQVIEMAASPNHLPAIFSLLVGLFVFKKEPRTYENDSDVPGDNVPATLLEGIGR
jgi:hypothetical protein